MHNRTKILVIDTDLETLSRVYLALIHRNYKAEASDKTSEVPERLKRFRPAIVIIRDDLYGLFQTSLKMPVIILGNEGKVKIEQAEDVRILPRPLSMERLLTEISSLII